MKLYLKDIKKLKEDSSNHLIQKHWKITGELSLSNEDSATIKFWKTYGGVGTEYTSHSTNVTLKNDDVFVINLDALSSYSTSTPIKHQEFTIEIYFNNSNNLRRKYIFTYYIDKDEQFIFKDSRLHLLK